MQHDATLERSILAPHLARRALQFFATLEKTKIQQDKEYDTVSAVPSLSLCNCALLASQHAPRTARRVRWLCVQVQVVAHYDLIEEFDIKVPDMQLAAYQTMDHDYTALRDAMWSGALLLADPMTHGWLAAVHASAPTLALT